jgi:hypothetical protein
MSRTDIPEPDEANFEGSHKVWLSVAEWNDQLVGALERVRPSGVALGYNVVGDRVWFMVSQPADTRRVYEEARRLLDEPG